LRAHHPAARAVSSDRPRTCQAAPAGRRRSASTLEAKFGQRLPLNRQSERYGREEVELSVSTLADWVGTAAAVLSPLHTLIEAHVLTAERLHGDDTTVPLLPRGKTVAARLWSYVRDDQPFAAPAPPAAVFYFSRDRTAEHPGQHLTAYSGILQANAVDPRHAVGAREGGRDRPDLCLRKPEQVSHGRPSFRQGSTAGSKRTRSADGP
jgi:hypothetical protein